MATKSEVRAFLKMADGDLEERLAIELGASQGVKVAASLSKGERAKRVQQLTRRLRTRVRAAIRASGPRIKKITCVDLKYCDRRETAVEVLVIGLVDAVIIEFTLIPLPMVALCAYTVKTRLLDDICECHKSIKRV